MKKIIIFILFANLAGCYSKEPEKTGLEGKVFPSFSIQEADSLSFVQATPTRNNKPIALFYFGTHCPYSREQAQEIVDDMDRLKDIQFYFVTSSPLPEMRKFIQKYQLDKYPNIITGRDTARFVADYYEITGVPYIALYRTDKKFNKAYYGKFYSKQIIAGTHEQ